MSDDARPDVEPPQRDHDGQGGDEPGDNQPDRGPNLTLLYGLIALALAVAIGLAALIVRPFYLRR